MWVVGATTATRATPPSQSIRWATWRPNVVLPAAGVAETRKASPSWPNTATAAACCQARRGRPAGQAGSVPRTGGAMGCVTEAGRLPGRPDEPEGDSPLYVGRRGRTCADRRTGTRVDVPAGHAATDGLWAPPGRDLDAADGGDRGRRVRPRGGAGAAAAGMDGDRRGGDAGGAGERDGPGPGGGGAPRAAGRGAAGGAGPTGGRPRRPAGAGAPG